MGYIAIIGILLIILVIATLYGEFIKTLKQQMLIDGYILVVMSIILFATGIQFNTAMCVALFLIWIFLGAGVRFFYSKFTHWLENKLLKMSGLPQNPPGVNEETSGADSYACKLLYFTIDV